MADYEGLYNGKPETIEYLGDGKLLLRTVTHGDGTVSAMIYELKVLAEFENMEQALKAAKSMEYPIGKE